MIEKIFYKAASWQQESAKLRVGEDFRQKAYKVTFEYKIGEGKTFDIVAEKNRKRIAIETGCIFVYPILIFF